jgi:hypothetical protein
VLAPPPCALPSLLYLPLPSAHLARVDAFLALRRAILAAELLDVDAITVRRSAGPNVPQPNAIEQYHELHQKHVPQLSMHCAPHPATLRGREKGDGLALLQPARENPRHHVAFSMS